MTSIPTSLQTVPTPRTRLVDVPRPALVALLGWVALALASAASGLLDAAPPLIGLLFAVAVGGTLIAWRRSPTLRAWTQGLDLRVPIALHVARFGFGTMFLVELAAGHLPATFAERGGYGDILAGALAILAIVLVGSPGRHGRQPASDLGRAAAWTFSVVGLADILLVFGTGQYLVFVAHDPLVVGAIGRLPYALLPTLVVPLVVLTHVLVMQRLRAARHGAAAGVFT